MEIVTHDSPVDAVTFRGKQYFIKRDDLLRPFPGNKARKLQGLLKQDWNAIHRLVSHGGNQSNAMLALAQLANLKKIPFHYHTRPLPRWLKNNPLGNLRAALELDMRLVEDAQPPERADFPSDTLFVPQGVAMPAAEEGMQSLAEELALFIHQQQLAALIVFVPSGTGATALYLQKHLQIPVYTTPVVGDADYLRQQFRALAPEIAACSGRLPQIINPPRKHPFGKPDRDFIEIWRELHRDTGIEFDLLYDPAGWLALLQLGYEGAIIYVHCGGVEGNGAMLSRYRREGF